MTNQIAPTILAQLGGGRFLAMTGAKGLLGLPNGLAFQIGRNATRANRVRVTLDASDTYTITTSRYAKLNVTPVAKLEGVYAEDLQRAFTDLTGLDTHL